MMDIERFKKVYSDVVEDLTEEEVKKLYSWYEEDPEQFHPSMVNQLEVDELEEEANVILGTNTQSYFCRICGRSFYWNPGTSELSIPPHCPKGHAI